MWKLSNGDRARFDVASKWGIMRGLWRGLMEMDVATNPCHLGPQRSIHGVKSNHGIYVDVRLGALAVL